VDESGRLTVWLDALLPALDHFVTAAEGHPDIAFWGSICNLCGVSGGVESPMTGWISVFFPYIIPPSHRPAFCLKRWVSCFEKAKGLELHGL
jgi:hypothetical protein